MLRITGLDQSRTTYIKCQLLQLIQDTLEVPLHEDDTDDAFTTSKRHKQ